MVISVAARVFGWGGSMNADRRMRLWGLVVERTDGEPVAVEHVCAAMLSAAGVDGAAVAVRLSATPRETLYASDRVASELEELTLTLGEGPGEDAFAGGPLLDEDLRLQLHGWSQHRYVAAIVDTIACATGGVVMSECPLIKSSALRLCSLPGWSA